MWKRLSLTPQLSQQQQDTHAPLLDWSLDEDGSQHNAEAWHRPSGPSENVQQPRSKAIQVPSARSKRWHDDEQQYPAAYKAPMVDLPPDLFTPLTDSQGEGGPDIEQHHQSTGIQANDLIFSGLQWSAHSTAGKPGAMCSKADGHQQHPSGKTSLQAVPEIQPVAGSISSRGTGEATSSTWTLKQPLLPQSFEAAYRQGSSSVAQCQVFEPAGCQSRPTQEGGGSQPPHTSVHTQSVPEGGGQMPSRQQLPEKTVGPGGHQKQGGARRCSRTAQGDSHHVRSVAVNCTPANGEWRPPHTCVHCGHGEAVQDGAGRCAELQRQGGVSALSSMFSRFWPSNQQEPQNGGRLSGGHAISRGAKVFGVEGTSPQSPLSGNRLSRYSSFTEPWSSGSSREGRSLVKHLSSLGGSRLSRASAPEEVWVNREQERLWQGSLTGQGLHPQLSWSLQMDRSANAVRQWKQSGKWLLLYLVLSCLTIMHSAALVYSLGFTLFATICASMFSWSGVFGIFGSSRALLGILLARSKDPDTALEGLHLKSVELTGFTTAILSGVAAGIHLITIQIVINDGHVPACTAGDRTCAEGIGLIVVMMVATTVLYGCHCIISGIVAFSAHSTSSVAKAPTTTTLPYAEY